MGVALVLLTPGTRALGAGASRGRTAKRVLLFTRSQNFEHSIVKVGPNGRPPFALAVISALATAHGWEVDHTKDGQRFTPAGLAPYDAFVFITCGDLAAAKLAVDVAGQPMTPDGDDDRAMPPDGKQALLDAVASGKGFVALHSTACSFLTPGDPWASAEPAVRDAFPRMTGGEFIAHGVQQKGRARVVDHAFPGFEALPDLVELHEEWYSLKNFAPDLHVLLVLEPAGMAGAAYQRPPYPLAWARVHGKGRVFFLSLAHREDVWTTSAFQRMLDGGLRWSLGEARADVRPNLTRVAPESATMPVRPPPKPAAAPAPPVSPSRVDAR
jgi:type 1 glutamine amidotransferase